MFVIEPHIHMIARTTADYERMARMHTVACCEPSFWAGYDRTSPQAFYDYFTHISTFEPTRAAQYSIDHYCWICMNPKEAEDVAFSREVIAFIPEFLEKPTALGVGEIGLNLNTRNEMTVFEEQVEVALKHDVLIWIHTPHLKDKLKGTRMMVDYLKGHGGVDPEKVCFRPLRGTHLENGTRRRFLGIHDHLSHHQEFAGAGRGRHRDFRAGEDDGGCLGRLGAVGPGYPARRHFRDAQTGA